ncbi:hypothetical protein [Micromonospora echinofusca]|uniref:Uncharacterized protein n=1 Tax=Micromonospora echinofusca TaxID=47858 RepID=A0ABS3VQL5_MICEH|nr:hypothetical protein [Micromonospora echinofusca]MBO4206829.1 hypothetical protein [Micromonospora echinofusca]
MHPLTVDGNPRLSLWRQVREFAVPPSMISTATARRAVGDWAGACAAARVDVDLDLRRLARTHGTDLAGRIRDDLRHLAPDLLRWHLPRIAPEGLLRPGLTIPLAHYRDGPLHLVLRTPPAWADAGQRISLALWDGSRSHTGAHPHPRPHRRFRLDLHRHLWDVRRTDELRTRSGADRPSVGAVSPPSAGTPAPPPVDGQPTVDVLRDQGYAVDRWAAEADLLLRQHGRTGGAVTVRLATRCWLTLDLTVDGDTDPVPGVRITTAAPGGRASGLPVLPDAATWVPPDLALLRAGLIDVDRLHPLVASALVPDRPPAGDPPVADAVTHQRPVECRGARHRIGLVAGVLVALDHDPAEIRREELLAALTGTPLPCLRAIDEAHRHPEQLADIRARLHHGDTAGALAAVEDLLGPDALLRTGALRDELATAALRRVTYGLFRAGLAGTGRGPYRARPGYRPCDHRPHPRHATYR